MKQTVFLIMMLGSFLFVSNVFAQRLETKIVVRHPDYSGTWKLNPDKCSGLDRFYDKKSKVNRILIIRQELPAVYITYKIQKGTSKDENYFGEQFTLYADGRGDEYVYNGLGEKQTSITKWVNNKLFITSYILGKIKPENIESTQEFTLSGDTKTLIQRWRITSPVILSDQTEQRKFNELMTSVLVYERIN